MKRPRALRVALVVALVPACARERQSAPSAAEPPPAALQERPTSLRAEVDAMDVPTAYAALRAATTSFDTAFTASQPDCATGRILGERLCALADRLCRLADEHPEQSEVRAYCDDGKTRCAAAKQRIASRCD
jgi:hypothetical protein